MKVQLPPSWMAVVGGELEKPYFKELEKFVDAEREKHTIYPPEEDVFNAFRYTPFDTMKVMLLGQDPYHGPNQAHGLSFSVRPGVRLPGSLVNICKELRDELGALADALEAARTALQEAEQKLLAHRPGSSVYEELVAKRRGQLAPGVEGFITARNEIVQLQIEFSRSTSQALAAIHRLATLSRHAANGIDVRHGPDKWHDLRRLVDQLADIFEQSSNRRAGRVWNAYTNRDISIFAPFCCRCLDAAGIPRDGPLTGIAQEVAKARAESRNRVRMRQ